MAACPVEAHVTQDPGPEGGDVLDEDQAVAVGEPLNGFRRRGGGHGLGGSQQRGQSGRVGHETDAGRVYPAELDRIDIDVHQVRVGRHKCPPLRGELGEAASQSHHEVRVAQRLLGLMNRAAPHIEDDPREMALIDARCTAL